MNDRSEYAKLNNISERKSNFFNFSQILDFLTSRAFIINVLLIILFLILVIFGIFQWLKAYTNHGQRLELPNYLEAHVDEARKDAEEKTFQLIVNDSTHVVGKPGGIILNQNPKGGSFVKEKRKIYVTISKYRPDLIALEDLPRLYGENFEMKAAELRSRQLKPRIIGTKYDPIGNFTILEVHYNGEKIVDNTGKKEGVEIEKGSYIDMVISSPEGGSHVIPNLIGKPLDAAYMIAETLKLQIGEVTETGEIKQKDLGNAIVTEQYPAHDGTTTLATGERINVTVSARQ